ncbi:MAG: hypothetical protein KDD41_03825 [Flavobacteriales bacterium]|nr:hypothetical protein [Flavobacteriales bacterium]
MRVILTFITVMVTVSLVFTSCKSKLDQKTMFNGRSHKNKKGVYDTGLNRKKAVSVQLAEEWDKETKHDTNPKKAAKKEEQARLKKQREAQKKRDKYNKKRHVKVKTTKGKSNGDT